MEKTMISYDLSGIKNPLEITRKIYGYIDSSNNGKYKYLRKGILTDISYEKIARTVFWINPKNKEKVIIAFKKLKLKTKIFDLIIKN